MRRLSVLIMFYYLLLSICTFTGCDERSEPIAVIPDNITVVNITHVVGGQSTKFTIEGDSLDDLRVWVSELQYKYQTYTKGNSPGDSEGGEVYTFEMPEGDYPGFSYIINGKNKCYLLIEGEWYSVSNPSNPPIVE